MTYVSRQHRFAAQSAAVLAPVARENALAAARPAGAESRLRGRSAERLATTACLAISRGPLPSPNSSDRSEEHTSELQSRFDLVCRLLLEKKKNKTYQYTAKLNYNGINTLTYQASDSSLLTSLAPVTTPINPFNAAIVAPD